MNKSDSIKELATALAKAQIKIEGAAKDKNNPFFKTKYADLASVVDAIRESLSEEGLSYVQIIHDAPDAAKVETLILHASGEWLSAGILSVPVSKLDAQGFGSAFTYARRYSLSAAFGVAPEDDDGNAASRPQEKPIPSFKKIDISKFLSESQILDHVAAIESADDLDSLKKIYSAAFVAAQHMEDHKALKRFETAKDARKLTLEDA